MVFAGHDLIAEDGTLLSETKPFAGDYAETELDCQRMESERARNTSFEHAGRRLHHGGVHLPPDGDR